MSKYSKALGLDSGHQVTTKLSVAGASEWAVSKTPAAAGGIFADWVYNKAVAKWPKAKRGPRFVGSVAVAIGAYGLQIAMAQVSPTSSHLVDKMTDGMIGRVAPEAWRLLVGLFEKDKKGDNQKSDTYVPPTDDEIFGTANASLDGDRQAVMEVGQLLQQSPETTQQIADQMFAIMKRDRVDMDPAGQQAVVRSMREAAAKLAKGNF